MTTDQRPVVVVTQARVSSTRLPGKVLRPMRGRPMLWWHLSRLLRCRSVDRIVVATTEEPAADQIVTLAEELGVAAYRGSLDDVLSRYAGAAEMAAAATIVRVTSDCPLIDPLLLDHLVESFLGDPGCDYSSLDISQFPRGLDCEVFKRKVLDETARDARLPEEREHVTPYIRAHPERYRLKFLAPPSVLPTYRWCVDTAEDFAEVEQLLAEVGEGRLDFTWQELAALTDKRRS